MTGADVIFLSAEEWQELVEAGEELRMGKYETLLKGLMEADLIENYQMQGEFLATIWFKRPPTQLTDHYCQCAAYNDPTSERCWKCGGRIVKRTTP